MRKKLLKSRTDIKIDGVCAGLANYFDMDVTIVRMIFVVLAIISAGVPMFFLYIAAIAVMPREDNYIDSYKN